MLFLRCFITLCLVLICAVPSAHAGDWRTQYSSWISRFDSPKKLELLEKVMNFASDWSKDDVIPILQALIDEKSPIDEAFYSAFATMTTENVMVSSLALDAIATGKKELGQVGIAFDHLPADRAELEHLLSERIKAQIEKLDYLAKEFSSISNFHDQLSNLMPAARDAVFVDTLSGHNTGLYSLYHFSLNTSARLYLQLLFYTQTHLKVTTKNKPPHFPVIISEEVAVKAQELTKSEYRIYMREHRDVVTAEMVKGYYFEGEDFAEKADELRFLATLYENGAVERIWLAVEFVKIAPLTELLKDKAWWQKEVPMHRLQNILLYRAQNLEELKDFLPAFDGMKNEEGLEATIYPNDWLSWGEKVNVNLNANQYLDLIRIVARLAPETVQKGAFEVASARHMLEMTQDAKSFIAKANDLPWLEEDLTHTAGWMKLIPTNTESAKTAKKTGGLIRWISKICNFNYSKQK